jgi:protocatechuate 3,4-dioxygenase beta subunit
MSNTLAHANARRALAALLLLLGTSAHAFARQAAAATPPAKDPATVSGRVTNAGGGPARDVPVVLMPAERVSQMKPVARGSTDEEGRYKLTNVPPGRYRLTAVSPGYVFAEAGAGGWQSGKVVNVAPGDELKDLDFTLVRGGAVTGRVTDADGKPVVEELVTLVPADPRARGEGQYARPSAAATDDRGVYRAWGLAPGRYLVYAGSSREENWRRGDFDAGAFYPKTFYPSVSDESQARAVEVAAGGEAGDFDITLPKLTRTFKASGRVSDEEGRPVAGVTIALGPMAAGAKRFNGNVSTGAKTDERGEFVVRGLLPGDWGVWASAGEVYGGESQGASYSDAAVFEVTDSDVSGLEIKMRRGAEVSGVITLEGVSDPAVLAKFRELRLGAWVNTGDSAGVPNYAQIKAGADGSFRLTGLRPGRLMLDLEWPRPKGFSLLYVKRDGVEQREGLEVRAGERVKNVQVAYAYGAAVVRGEVEFRGGARPAGVTYVVHALRPGGLVAGEPAALDSLGRFQIENLSAGEYELSLSDWSPNATNRSPLARLTINVPAEGEVKATLVYDMSPKKEER